MLGAFSIVEPLWKGALGRVGRKAVRGLQLALSEAAPPPARSRLTDLQDRLVVPGLLGFANVGYHWHKRSWRPLAVALRGRTAVVTGATSGLGQAAASQLAEPGARAILVGRNPDMAEATRREIVAATGNDDVAVALADLSLLAPCLLTGMLLPRITKSAPSRIIDVASGGIYATGLALDDLQYERTTYDGSRAYAPTKRALPTLTQMRAEQLQNSGVVVHAMHPGWADTPGVAGSLLAFDHPALIAGCIGETDFQGDSIMNSKKTKTPAIDIGISGGDRTARELRPVVDAANDPPTADLPQRLEVHEKTAWMLRSLLEHRSIGHRLISSPGGLKPVSP